MGRVCKGIASGLPCAKQLALLGAGELHLLVITSTKIVRSTHESCTRLRLDTVVILPVVRSASAWAAFAAFTQVVCPLLCVLAWCILVALPLIGQLLNLGHLQELVVILGREDIVAWRWRRWKASFCARNWLEINVQVLGAALLKILISAICHSVGGVHAMSPVPGHRIVAELTECLLALVQELIWVERLTSLAVASVVLSVAIARVEVHLRADIIALVVLAGTPLVEALALVRAVLLEVLVGWAGQENSEVALNLLGG
jgi:hypothetical protein